MDPETARMSALARRYGIAGLAAGAATLVADVWLPSWLLYPLGIVSTVLILASIEQHGRVRARRLAALLASSLEEGRALARGPHTVVWLRPAPRAGSPSPELSRADTVLAASPGSAAAHRRRFTAPAGVRISEPVPRQPIAMPARQRLATAPASKPLVLAVS